VERLEKELGEADKVAAEFKRMAELADTEFKAELDEVFSALERREFLTQRRKGAESAESACPMVRLGDVCKKVARLKDIEDSVISYIDISSVDRATKKVVETKEYDRKSAPGRAQQVVEKNDVLVSTVRPNLNAVAIVENSSSNQLIASTGFCVLRANEQIQSRYIYYFVQDGQFIGKLVAVSEKASYPSVTDTIVKDVYIPLPPLSVQKGIVAKLDAAKEMCEKLKAEAERGLKAAENLRKAILSEAFE
jgi:type I restriction enzyme S subunit